MKLKIIGLLFLFSASPSVAARTRVGVEVLRDSKFEQLKNTHVALITNHTGVDAKGRSTVDILHKAKHVHLKVILTPEHGFRGQTTHGVKVGHSKDKKTNLPIYSLYGDTTKPTKDMLKGVDTLVYDIQDVGVRFYTYITTMGQALEVAAKNNLRFVVLDRPNPIRGDIIEGDLLDADIKRFTGYFRIPIRYGLTPGELALWINWFYKLKAELSVVPMKKWKRHYWYDQTHLPFIPPSPNIRTLLSAILYSGIGCFEATNVSVGRGTRTPFEIIGAPWINGRALCAHMREQNIPGALFEPAVFKPENDLYNGEICHGIKIIVTNRETLRPFDVFLAAFQYLSSHYKTEFQPDWEELRVMTGSRRLKNSIKKGLSYETLRSQYDKKSVDFKNQINSFIIYK